jgi:AcrR family transcriptional regulator
MSTVMSEGTSVAPVPLRDEQVARTRQRILDAVVALVSERGDASFSMPEVARASGVGLRTVYRYYPTRQDLVDAVAAVGDQVAASNLPAAEFSVEGFGTWLEQAWGNLLEHEAFIRAQHSSPNGAEIRRARIPFFREVTRVLLEREVPGLRDMDDVVDTLLLLTSSSALFELIDVLEIPLERAAQLASGAVRAVLDQHG